VFTCIASRGLQPLPHRACTAFREKNRALHVFLGDPPIPKGLQNSTVWPSSPRKGTRLTSSHYKQVHTLESMNLLRDHSFCLNYSKGSTTATIGRTIRTNSQPHYESDPAHEIQDSFFFMPRLHGIGLFSAALGTSNSLTLSTHKALYLFIYLFLYYFFLGYLLVSRKLTVSGRSAVEARSTTTQAEAELEREEEEMLAMTRLLKQVDETEAVSVAKKLILEASGSSQVSNGHSQDSVTAQQDDTIVDQPSHGKIQTIWRRIYVVGLGMVEYSRSHRCRDINESYLEACFRILVAS